MGWLGECPIKCIFKSRKEAEKRLEAYRTLPGALDEEELIDMGIAIGYLEALKQEEIEHEEIDAKVAKVVSLLWKTAAVFAAVGLAFGYIFWGG